MDTWLTANGGRKGVTRKSSQRILEREKGKLGREEAGEKQIQESEILESDRWIVGIRGGNLREVRGML